MRKSAILIALFVLFSIAISGCLSSSKPSTDLLEPRENSEGGLSMTITYLPDITDASAFEINVMTHSNYNDDFENSSYLQDSSGKIYKPISYEGSTGHHASGVLKFQKIESKSFELVFQDVGSVKERVFKW